MAQENKRKLTRKQQIRAIARIAKLSFMAAPAAVIVKLIGSLINAALPLVVTYFAALTTTALADAYAGDETAGSRAMMYVIITASLGVILTGWSSLEQYVNELARYRINASVSDKMYRHFLSLDFWRYDDKDTVDVFDKSKQFANFFGYVFDSITRIVTDFITVVTALFALVFVSWWLGLIVIVAVIPSVLIQFALSRRQIDHWNSNIETRRALNMIEWDMFEPKHIAELRLYGMVKHLLRLRQSLRDKDEKQRIEFERTFILKRLGADVLEAAAEVIALLYTTFQIIGGLQPIGQFLYVQQVVSRALGGARSFVSSVSSIDEDLANLFDYQAFMELPEHNGGTHILARESHSIEVKNISFAYPNTDVNVLDGVSFTIQKGKHVAIVGENGAGKSTLIKLLTGLYQPTSGVITVGGQDLAEVDIASWHRCLAVLQQDYLSYGFATAKSNVYFGDVSATLDEKRFKDAVQRAEAATFLEKLPKGYDSYVINWMEHDDGTKGTSLSGGQWQRLALARNFYRDSPIIILDEPTSAIDALAESRIFKYLFQESDKTVITISHRLSTVEKADIIYVIKDGKVVESGAHHELVTLRGEYFTIFESQLH